MDDTNNNRSNDKTTSDDVLNRWYDSLCVSSNDAFLDFGCGFCRLYPYYKSCHETSNYTGVDIAESPLKIANSKFPELNIGKNLFVYDGERIPFREESFDKIICFGVFDACKQNSILAELLRVLKVDGMLLLTGKNDHYYIDDEEAYVAEVNARKKGHPNSFTDVKVMRDIIKVWGGKLEDTYYFLRRGDFAKGEFQKNMPDCFYEWCFFISKQSAFLAEKDEIERTIISNSYSKTFLNREKK